MRSPHIPHTPVGGTSTKQVGQTAATRSGTVGRRGAAALAARAVERRTRASSSDSTGAGGGGRCAAQWKRTTPAWLWGLRRRTAHSSVRSRGSEAGPHSEQRVGSPGTTSATSTGTPKGRSSRQSVEPVIFTPPRYAHGGVPVDRLCSADTRDGDAVVGCSKQ